MRFRAVDSLMSLGCKILSVSFSRLAVQLVHLSLHAVSGRGGNRLLSSCSLLCFRRAPPLLLCCIIIGSVGKLLLFLDE